MNNEEFNAPLEQAGLAIDDCDWELIDVFERFAALVAAAEREECAKVCLENYAIGCAAAIRARGGKK